MIHPLPINLKEGVIDMKATLLGLIGAVLSVSTFSNAFANDFKGLTSWGYQLHDYKPEHISRMENSKNTLWVIDYSKDGTDEQKFSKEEISKFKKNGNVAISYFCLGEAEMTRYYWHQFNRDALIKRDEVAGIGYKNSPLNFTVIEGSEILGRDNAEYADNFPAKFWLPAWQKTMIEDSAESGISYLNRIIAAGFDGVYLDTVDAFEYYNEKSIATRAKQMYEFVIKIAKLGRAKNPNFKIMMQNGMSIAGHLSETEKATLFSYVKGFGVEDLFHPGAGDNNPRKFSKSGEFKEIKEIRSKFKDITFFTVDYIPGLSQEDKASYFKDAHKKDLIPVISDRSLSGNMLLFRP